MGRCSCRQRGDVTVVAQLPVPYFHVVFTVPAEVAALALGNKKVVYSILFRAASEALLEAATNPEHLGALVSKLQQTGVDVTQPGPTSLRARGGSRFSARIRGGSEAAQ